MSESNGCNSDVANRMMEILRKGRFEQISQRGLLDYLEVELFEFYTKQTNEWLIHDFKIEQKATNKQIKNGDPNLNDSGLMAIDFHNKRIQYSNVIYLTSILETCLQRACDNLELALGGVPFKLSDLKGDQWTKRYSFFERYGQFSFSEPLIRDLKTLTKIRNFLVHENGSTINLNKEDQKLIGKCVGVNISTYEFKIDPPYIQHALNLLKQLVEELNKQMAIVIHKLEEPQIQL